MSDQTKIFAVNSTYTMKFIGDSELKPSYKCISRTEKMATFQRVDGSETIKKKINNYQGEEYIRVGSYSMAPTIYARSLVN